MVVFRVLVWTETFYKTKILWLEIHFINEEENIRAKYMRILVLGPESEDWMMLLQ